MQKLVIVNNPADWSFDIQGIEIVSSKEYLTNPRYADLKNIRVFNLAKDYRYQSRGYYVSLLAEARGHKPLPDVKNIIDFKAPNLVKIVSEELDELVQKSLKPIKSDEFILSVYFGQNLAKKYRELSKELHKLFQAPLLRAKFVRAHKKWTLQNIKTVAINEIQSGHMPYVKKFAIEYFSKKRYDKARPEKYLHDLAILVDPGDDAPPSNKQAINKFVEAAEKSGFYVEVIGESDYHRLPAFDALLIRMNTHVKNFSYKFARKAQADGLAIIDYPENILKCGNKVYLSELLQIGNIRVPESMIVHQDNKNLVLEKMKLPCVLKLPDSTFSVGVKKVSTEDEMKAELQRMFEVSDLVIAQEYLYTDFDWRIGVLDGNPIYACKYYMAKGHWQIYNWKATKKREQAGLADTFAIEQAPPDIVNAAVKACNLVNKKGLFGVDVKESNGKAYVIEVNDNPNIDFGTEDFVLKDELYQIIIKAFKKRIDEKIGISS